MKLWDVELMEYELPASLEAAKVASSIVFRSPREILRSAREEGIDQVKAVKVGWDKWRGERPQAIQSAGEGRPLWLGDVDVPCWWNNWRDSMGTETFDGQAGDDGLLLGWT